MQLRRVLLLFALVLGASAVVASVIAPPPETAQDAPAPSSEPPTASARPAAEGERLVSFEVPRRKPRAAETRRVSAGAAVSLRVGVRAPGDVSVDNLGLRQTADPLTPARFDFVAGVPGRHSIEFQPVDGSVWLVGRLVVTPRRRGR